jgi:putative FmdB family regulatory protein
MPVYEYVCDACGYGFERIQSFNDDPVEVCPNCKGKVRRVISPVGVIFKGSGWYITDNRRQISGTGRASISDRTDSYGDKAEPASSDKADAASKKDDSASKKAKSTSGTGDKADKKTKSAAKTTD